MQTTRSQRSDGPVSRANVSDGSDGGRTSSNHSLVIACLTAPIGSRSRVSRNTLSLVMDMARYSAAGMSYAGPEGVSGTMCAPQRVAMALR
jgi:hypothetical protein